MCVLSMREHYGDGGLNASVELEARKNYDGLRRSKISVLRKCIAVGLQFMIRNLLVIWPPLTELISLEERRNLT